MGFQEWGLGGSGAQEVFVGIMDLGYSDITWVFEVIGFRRNAFEKFFLGIYEFTGSSRLRRFLWRCCIYRVQEPLYGIIGQGVFEGSGGYY